MLEIIVEVREALGVEFLGAMLRAKGRGSAV